MGMAIWLSRLCMGQDRRAVACTGLVMLGMDNVHAMWAIVVLLARSKTVLARMVVHATCRGNVSKKAKPRQLTWSANVNVISPTTERHVSTSGAPPPQLDLQIYHGEWLGVSTSSRR